MNKVVVTGATGTVGAHVVRELQQRGVAVRAFVRDMGKARDMLGDEVELVRGDFGDSTSVRQALEGGEGVFLACANHPRQVEYEIGVIEAARAAGVRRVVKLSALGAEVSSPVAFWDWHGQIEQHVRASGVEAVLLQPSFNMTNVLGSVDQIKQARSLFLPAEGARVAMIDPRDIAAVAAAVLTEGRHGGNIHVLTGPQALTFADVAQELSSVTGQHIQFVAVPDGVALHGLVESGIPEFVASQIVAVFGFLRNGMQNYTTETVHAITARAPRSFADFARDYAPMFQPSPQGLQAV